MKKKIVFLLILIFIGVSTMAGGLPIMPKKQDGYTLSEARNLCFGYSKLSQNFRREFVEIVRHGLSEAGSDLVLTERNINWIFGNISYENVTLEPGYINSYKNQLGEIIFFPDYRSKGPVSVVVAVFSFKRIRILLFKRECLNLLKIPMNRLVLEQEDPTHKKNVSTKKAQEGTTIIIVNNYSRNQRSGYYSGYVEGYPTTYRMYPSSYYGGYGYYNRGYGVLGAALIIRALVGHKHYQGLYQPRYSQNHYIRRSYGSPAGAPGHSAGSPAGAYGHGSSSSRFGSGSHYRR